MEPLFIVGSATYSAQHNQRELFGVGSAQCHQLMKKPLIISQNLLHLATKKNVSNKYEKLNGQIKFTYSK